MRCLRSLSTPGESRCRCLFEAASGDLVQEVSDAAQIPYSRIMLAVELPATEHSADACNVAADAGRQNDDSEYMHRRR